MKIQILCFLCLLLPVVSHSILCIHFVSSRTRLFPLVKIMFLCINLRTQVKIIIHKHKSINIQAGYFQLYSCLSFPVPHKHFLCIRHYFTVFYIRDLGTRDTSIKAGFHLIKFKQALLYYVLCSTQSSFTCFHQTLYTFLFPPSQPHIQLIRTS
jgi:hypothetical protein